jgi:nitrate reductase NapAB chaperone NapD
MSERWDSVRVNSQPPPERALVNGLLLTLAQDEDLSDQACRQLEVFPGLTLGARNGSWLPAVLEASDEEGAHKLHEEIAEIPGVLHVDVVSIHFLSEGIDESCPSESL